MNSINGMMNQQVYQSYSYQQVEWLSQSKTSSKSAQNSGAEQDTVELGSQHKDNDYGTYKPDLSTISQLKAISQEHLNTLRQMVDKLLSSQSYSVQGMYSESYSYWAAAQSENGSFMESYGYSMEFKFEFSFSADFASSASQDVQAQAAAMVGEDGPLGVKSLSESILKFAKAICGGDASKIDLLFNATKKGFEQVAALFGGWGKLPEVTHKTYDAVKQGFDDWRAEAAGEEAEEVCA